MLELTVWGPVLASMESSTATWACACNTQSALRWDWNPFVRKLIKVGSLGENAKNKWGVLDDGTVIHANPTDLCGSLPNF
jgi:hypothetical protein